MANYYLNEAVFDLPERVFADKTIHALESELPSGQKLAVFVHRRVMDAGQSLRQLVDENVALNQARLHQYTVIDEAPADVGGLPGIRLRARWRHQSVMFYQNQAHVVVEGKRMIFAVTTPLAEQAACDETFAGILETITWRAG